MTLASKSLSYRSDPRVRGDCDHRPVPVCEGWCMYKYLRSIGDLKFSRKSVLLALVLCHTYMLLLYVSVCTYLHLFTNQALSKSIAC